MSSIFWHKTFRLIFDNLESKSPPKLVQSWQNLEGVQNLVDRSIFSQRSLGKRLPMVEQGRTWRPPPHVLTRLHRSRAANTCMDKLYELFITPLAAALEPSTQAGPCGRTSLRLYRPPRPPFGLLGAKDTFKDELKGSCF